MGALIGRRGVGLDPLCYKKMILGGANYSSHSKLLVQSNNQYFYIRVCRTKIRNRDYVEHCSGNILLFSDAIIPHRLWMFVGLILQSHREFADKTGRLCLVESGVEFFKLIFGWLDFSVPNSMAMTYQKLEYF